MLELGGARLGERANSERGVTVLSSAAAFSEFGSDLGAIADTKFQKSSLRRGRRNQHAMAHALPRTRPNIPTPP
jgi:hypothetical protein